ncbi:hypothetical protein MMC09_003221 [Bachmanniomyces sp. S44760]|nr:hypothetical protein [Bachmanniomyces sp. S44760]
MPLSSNVVVAFCTVLILYSVIVSANPTRQLAAGANSIHTITERQASSNTTSNPVDNDTGDDDDIAESDIGPYQFPPGRNITSPRVDSHPAIQPLVVAAAGSDLTSRDMTEWMTFSVTNGTFLTHDGENIYPVKVGKSVMQTFLQKAQNESWVYYKAGQLGSDPEHNYYRYASGVLSLIIVSYDSGSNGSDPFNWGDYSEVAKFLYARTLDDYADNDSTFAGHVRLEDGHDTPVADYAMITSFTDIQSANQTIVFTPEVLNSSASPDDGSGGRRLARRQPPEDLGAGYQMTFRRATQRVLYGLIGQLVVHAYNGLLMDDGLAPNYSGLAMKIDPNVVAADFPGNDIQLFAVVDDLPNGLVHEAIRALVQMSLEGNWIDRGGYTRARVGEILDPNGQIIARWSLGTMLTNVFPCLFRNPDGTVALGCFIKDHEL